MKRLLAAVLLLSLLFAPAGCKPAQPTDTTLFLMDTAMELRVYGDGDGAVTAELTDLLTALDRDLDPDDANGALYALNRTGRSDDAVLADLLSYAKTLSAQTGGAFDVTLLPLSKLWGFGADRYTIPTEEKRSVTAKRTGMYKVTVENGVVTLANETEIDLGAIAKGYAAERCAEIMAAHEKAGILSLGGNVQTVGEKPDRLPWAVGIQDPDGKVDYLLTLTFRGSKALVTSGDYQRYFEYDGVRYCHILDPATAGPVQGDLRSVTVVADSARMADALSTALFVMGLEQATAFWKLNAGAFDLVFVTKDGRILVTEGLEDLASGATFEVIRP